MSKQTVLSDPIRFAADFRQLEGVVALQGLSRLADSLVSKTGGLAYSVFGEKGEDGKPYLTLKVSGVLGLRCERCLEQVDWPVELERLYQLFPPGVDIPDEELEDDHYDAITAEPGLDVLVLLEDEVILSLPIAPTHVSCEHPRSGNEDAKESPFAALAALRRDGQAGQV